MRDGSVTVTGALKWTVAGVPSHWGPGTFQQWLEKQGWADFKHVKAGANGRDWTCVGKPSETGEGPFAYQVGEQVITITKWTHAKPVASEVWHARGSKWFTVDGKEAGTEVMEVDCQLEAPPTALDSPSTATQNEPENGKNASPSKQPTEGLSLSPPRSPLLLLVPLVLDVRFERPRTDLEVPPSGTLRGMATVAAGPSLLLVLPARANPSMRFKPTLKISQNRSKLAVLLGYNSIVNGRPTGLLIPPQMLKWRMVSRPRLLPSISQP